MKKRALSYILTACFVYVSISLYIAPKMKASAENALFSRAECVMEQHSRRILYEKDGELRLPMASTTKIATAIIVLENCPNLEEKITISQEAEGVEGSSVYLKQGEIYSVKDLLHGLMLRSGNDCATALALHCCSSISDFCVKMNKTAQKAGALHTRFVNPHGLPQKGHYTTARDLTYIACYAMENPIFRQIVATPYYEPCHWKNKNKLLSQYDECIGIKTGYTKEAGRCLVSAAQRDNMTVVCSVLDSPDMYNRSQELLNDALNAYRNVKIIDKNDRFPVEDTKSVGCVRQDVYYPLLEEEREQVELKICPYRTARKDFQGKIIGEIQIYLSKRLLFSKNLYKL